MKYIILAALCMALNISSISAQENETSSEERNLTVQSALSSAGSDFANSLDEDEDDDDDSEEEEDYSAEYDD